MCSARDGKELFRAPLWGMIQSLAWAPDGRSVAGSVFRGYCGFAVEVRDAASGVDVCA